MYLTKLLTIVQKLNLYLISQSHETSWSLLYCLLINKDSLLDHEWNDVKRKVLQNILADPVCILLG